MFNVLFSIFLVISKKKKCHLNCLCESCKMKCCRPRIQTRRRTQATSITRLSFYLSCALFLTHTFPHPNRFWFFVSFLVSRGVFLFIVIRHNGCNIVYENVINKFNQNVLHVRRARGNVENACYAIIYIYYIVTIVNIVANQIIYQINYTEHITLVQKATTNMVELY